MQSRRVGVGVCLGVIGVLCGMSPAAGGTLDERRFAWAFDANYLETDAENSTMNVRFAWGYLAGSGFAEVGVSGSYVKIEDQTFTDPTQSITIAGPYFTWNWTPRSEHATGFITAEVGAIAGDVSGIYDYSAKGAVGVKFFVGDSAGVTLQYFKQSFQTTDDYGDTEQLSGIAIGIVLFSGHKN